MTPEYPRQVFRSSLARWGSYAWFVLAALNIVDITVRGSGQGGRVAFAVVVAVTVLVYLVAFRPAVVLDGRTVVLRNVFRDVTVPLPAVTQADATDALRVHAGARVYRSWAVQVPNRERARVRQRVRSTGRSHDAVSDDVRDAVAGRTHADFVAEQIQQAKQRFDTGRDDPAAEVSSGQPGPGGDPYRRWNVLGTVSLAVAVVIVLVTIALP